MQRDSKPDRPSQVHFPPRVDRVDIFDNPRRDEPGQPPKLSMAWRGAQCLDETRDHAESLFAGHFLNEDGLDFGKYVQKGSVALDIGACYRDRSVHKHSALCL